MSKKKQTEFSRLRSLNAKLDNYLREKEQKEKERQTKKSFQDKKKEQKSVLLTLKNLWNTDVL